MSDCKCDPVDCDCPPNITLVDYESFQRLEEKLRAAETVIEAARAVYYDSSLGLTTAGAERNHTILGEKLAEYDATMGTK